MGFSEKIKNLRQERLLSQEAQPTYKALRTIKEYCEKNNVEFSVDLNIERGSTNG